MRAALRTLQADYAERGIELVQRGERWHFQTAADMARAMGAQVTPARLDEAAAGKA